MKLRRTFVTHKTNNKPMSPAETVIISGAIRCDKESPPTPFHMLSGRLRLPDTASMPSSLHQSGNYPSAIEAPGMIPPYRPPSLIFAPIELRMLWTQPELFSPWRNAYHLNPAVWTFSARTFR
ncbi:hypothetical protein HYPSUDRAFT_42166 [Hypholoma sublateritium FD-334 SS-4]|uniref:Uncharacterized protein n=1 Tax=Hypholoma sublateritium (strain FD-334 SS-4) TaxID=945553 RepID=A0A0D2L3G6_HYPSF|nr:hypothetical protein HYPSUDRAFT_42166 [Hypholoma sublateritium FD-334 SS-4]